MINIYGSSSWKSLGKISRRHQTTELIKIFLELVLIAYSLNCQTAWNYKIDVVKRKLEKHINLINESVSANVFNAFIRKSCSQLLFWLTLRQSCMNRENQIEVFFALNSPMSLHSKPIRAKWISHIEKLSSYRNW